MATYPDICTSHFFGVYPHKDWLTASWYENGVYVLDFSDPADVKEIAHADPEGAVFWSAYPYRGYVLANRRLEPRRPMGVQADEGCRLSRLRRGSLRRSAARHRSR